MKLADLKRLPIGTKLRLVNCLMGPVPDGKQSRIVAIVQSNAIALNRPDAPDRLSWLWFPKAKDFRDDGDGGFSILEEGEIAAQYKMGE